MKASNYMRLPKIRIHIWGGFGSQLFGMLAALRLQKMYPNRIVHIYFHSSGVTERQLELPGTLLTSFEYSQVQDFNNRAIFSNADHAPALKTTIRKLVKHLLLFFGFSAQLNYENDWTKLKKHLVCVRGHYTRINISVAEMAWLFDALNHDCKEPTAANCFHSLTIHFRLGDLLSLASKTHIDPKRLSVLVNKIDHDGIIRVISDSPIAEVSTLVEDFKEFDSCEIVQHSVSNAICESLKSWHFIGTNSKISLIISILRTTILNQGSTFLPSEMKSVYNSLTASVPRTSSINFY